MGMKYILDCAINRWIQNHKAAISSFYDDDEPSLEELKAESENDSDDK